MRLRWLSFGLLLTGIAVIAGSQGHAQLYGQTSQDNASLQGQNTQPENVLLILDASDSMNERMGGRPKIQQAKDVILKTIRSMPPNINVGLRVYGHRLGRHPNLALYAPFGGMMMSNELCRQTQLLVPLGTQNRASIAGQLLEIEAMGKTPITYSLREAVNNDFINVVGKKTIILVSDGRETCSYNPCDLALDMVRAGVDIKINTIGFGTTDRVANDQLRCVAASTKGKFYNANTAAELAKSLQDSVQAQTRVQAKISPGP